MSGPAAPNRDQAELWSAETGTKWVDHEARLDATLAPVLDRLLAEAALDDGAAVLDIGCGTGASTLAVAQIVGPGGAAVGADISPVMLARARERAEQAGLANARFLEADAQTHSFADDGFDAAISRFGVMFFADPVAAFANMARGVRPGGRLTFLVWAGLEDNPWFALPRKAAVERLGPPEPTDPRAPGPMAFAERDYVAGILSRAGLREVRAEELTLDLTPPGTLREVAEFATCIGPAARLLKEKGGSDGDAEAIAERLCTDLRFCATPEGVRVPATLNLFAAKV